MEHKLDELQQQGSRLGPANLANHDQVSQLQHEVLQLTAENEVSCNLLTSPSFMQAQCTWSTIVDNISGNQNGKEHTAPFGVKFMRSPVLYRAVVTMCSSTCQVCVAQALFYQAGLFRASE